MNQPDIKTGEHPGWVRPGLYPSLWPCDHGDVQRSQCAEGGGLPAGVKVADLKSITNPVLHHPLFMYTRNSDELFVYGRAEGFSKGNYFARVDALTLEVRERFSLPFTPYVGGGWCMRTGMFIWSTAPDCITSPRDGYPPFGSESYRSSMAFLPSTTG